MMEKGEWFAEKQKSVRTEWVARLYQGPKDEAVIFRLNLDV